jgi:hypothetical protein
VSYMGVNTSHHHVSLLLCGLPRGPGQVVGDTSMGMTRSPATATVRAKTKVKVGEVTVSHQTPQQPNHCAGTGSLIGYTGLLTLQAVTKQL